MALHTGTYIICRAIAFTQHNFLHLTFMGLLGCSAMDGLAIAHSSCGISCHISKGKYSETPSVTHAPHRSWWVV